MRLKISPELSDILSRVRACLEPGNDLFLVGGSVRDLLLDCPPHDLDFVMSGDPTKLARCAAHHFDAGFFVLDDERHTARVMYRTPGGDLFPLDFVQFTGHSLEDDLRHRDFTINAMAISVNDLSTLIDPLNGQRDLETATLRACTSASLLDDPMRTLRAIRMAVQLGFQMDVDLGDLIRQAVPSLPGTSVERQRDELFRILEGPDPAQGMTYLYEYNLTRILFPSLARVESRTTSQQRFIMSLLGKIAKLKNYDRLLRIMQGLESLEERPGLRMQEAVLELLPFKDEITAYFSEEITPGRKKRSLALLGSILDGIDPESAWDAARHLALSNAESSWLRRMVGCGGKLKEMINQCEAPDRRLIYWYYKEAESAGVAAVLLILTESAGINGEDRIEASWHRVLAVSSAMLSAWFQEKDTVISPVLLLNGDDLQQGFGLKPGRRIGKLLAVLKEAQASGEVSTKEGASAFIRDRISNHPEDEDLS